MSINRFANDKTEKPFHSHGYAEAANQGGLGSASHQSFSQRMKIENNRTIIKRYRDSLIARERDKHDRDRKKDRFHREAPIANTRQAANAGEQNLGTTPDTGSIGSNRQAFREPPSRGYNPYG